MKVYYRALADEARQNRVTYKIKKPAFAINASAGGVGRSRRMAGRPLAPHDCATPQAGLRPSINFLKASPPLKFLI
jgi:hypothetical protein